jgi:perosamine synthetase
MASETRTKSPLAIHGGAPVRAKPLPYARQSVDERDVAAVVATLRSDWLTTGPAVPEFESRFARTVGAAHAVAVSSGTAALHVAACALELSPGDEVVVPAMTFAATANAVLYCGATPVFADIDPDTLLIDPADLARRLTPKTRAVFGVDYGGQPADWEAVRRVVAGRGIRLLDDACHALGGADRGAPVGTLADVSTFSLHPAKQVTCGEGGVVTTEDADLAARMRALRNHGITTDHRQRESRGSWEYEMVALGWNYRLTDFQCALAASQLERLEASIRRRREIAAYYDDALRALPLTPLARRAGAQHAFHLYVVLLDLARLSADRGAVFAALRAEGIGVNVHYIPVPRHPYYRKLGYRPEDTPAAEAAYERMLTLPLFPAMSDEDARSVVQALEKVCAAYAR